MEDEEFFKKYLKDTNYNKCIEIIKNKIVIYIVNLIKNKKKDYEYTDIIDLIDASNKYLSDEEKEIANKIEYFSIEEKDINKLERLMRLCKTYNIR